MKAASRWDDLTTRIGSALVLALIGFGAIWLGGGWFRTLVILCTAAMTWELARMVAPGGGRPLVLAALGAAAVYLATGMGGIWALIVTAVAVVCGTAALPRGRATWLMYAPVILLGAYGMVAFRDTGLPVVVWLVAVVVASDVAGYFAGRVLGGPKFWPRLSPKKTWSGTIAGWLAAVVVGGLAWAGGGSASLIWISPLIALAAQFGDIGESAVKRRAGVKDASNLIPGHGGLLDRFDALLGAALALLLAGAVAGLPAAG
jgi:phosphatidate cytidylyltransferase